MMILNLYTAGARDRQRESIRRFQRLEEAASSDILPTLNERRRRE